MRLFIGLDIAAQDALAIADWRARMLPPLTRPVPPENFHVTLAFLGDVTSRQLDPLVEQLDQITGTPFALAIDEVGYFPRPGILWVGPGETPQPLDRLARDVQTAARRAGLQIEKRAFRPHITLARRCDSPPPLSARPPAFEMRFDDFALFESVGGRRGVRYEVIGRWPLA